MITYEQAAQAIQERIGKDCRIMRAERWQYGWIFYWGLSNGGMLLGNGPMLVDARNGNVRRIATGMDMNEVLRSSIAWYVRRGQTFEPGRYQDSNDNISARRF